MSAATQVRCTCGVIVDPGDPTIGYRHVEVRELACERCKVRTSARPKPLEPDIAIAVARQRARCQEALRSNRRFAAIFLNTCLQDLVTRYVQAHPSVHVKDITLTELLEWSHRQTISPDGY